MNQLFSEQEILKIFEGSQWVPEEYRNASETDTYKAFRCKLDKLCGIFNSEPPANRLFSAEPLETPALCAFAPFYYFLRRELISVDKENVFQDGAFRDWGQSFPEALFQIFGNLALQELEACAGAMTTPSTLWVREKAMPCIHSGEHFRTMALRYPIFARQITEFIFLQLAHLRELIQALTEAERENADILCRILAETDHVLPEVSFPEDCLEIGLLHGMPGVMYSICRYLNPTRIPSLWQR